MAADARLVKNPAFEVEMVVNIRRLGEVLQKYRLPPSAAPDYARVVFAAALWDGKGRLPQALRREAEFLTESGILVPRDRVTEPVEPDVALDLALLDFVPERAREDALAIPARSLVLNPAIAVQRGTARPDGAEAIALPPWYDFPRGPNLLWVQDPASRSWAAHRPAATIAPIVGRLRRGTLAASALSPGTRELLQHARMLVPQDALRRAHADFSAECTRQARTLRRHGYAVVRGLVGPAQVAQMRRYLRARERAGYLEHDEPGPKNGARTLRLQTQNDVLATHLQRQTAHVIRSITGETIVPSFNWVSRYLPGAKLRRHVDRDKVGSRCDWSVWNASCLVESNHGMDLQRSWPLCLEVRGKPREFALDFGEAVVYAGRKTPHWRPTMAPGHEQTVLLLFYVPFDFPGALH